MTIQQLLMLALQTSILLTVFGFGLQATLDDVLHLLRRPSLLGRSLAAMFLFMPVLAVAMARAFNLMPAVEIALMALAISPVPPLLLKKEDKAGGQASYGLGLMAIFGVLSIVIVPVGARILGEVFGHPFSMAPRAIARVMLTTTVLPLTAGMVCRAILPAIARQIAKPIALVAAALLSVGILAILVAALPSALNLVGNGTLPAMAAFVVAALAVGHWLGAPRADHQVVLALSTATRHPAIALAIAKANFPDEPYLGAAILLYFVVATLIGLVYVTWRRHAARVLAAA